MLTDIYENRVVNIKDYVSRYTHKKDILIERKEQLVAEKEIAEKELKAVEKARDIVNAVAQQTLNHISMHVGQLVTQAIHAVFENPYDFKTDFVNRRNQTECDLYVTRNGIDRHPLQSNGGGLADVISTALRATFLVLSGNRLILLLDEPFKFLSEDLQNHCSIMLKTISEELGIQIIMVSHLSEMKDIADSIIYVTQVDGISSIIKVK